MTDREIVKKIAEKEYGCLYIEGVACESGRCPLVFVCKGADNSRKTAIQWLKDNPKEQGKPKPKQKKATQKQIEAGFEKLENTINNDVVAEMVSILKNNTLSALREAQYELQATKTALVDSLQLWEKDKSEVTRLREIVKEDTTLLRAYRATLRGIDIYTYNDSNPIIKRTDAALKFREEE